MLKEEAIFREILCKALYENNLIKQNELSQFLQISIGLANKIIHRLEQIGAMAKEGRSYHVTSFKKILMLWASIHNLQRELLYSTRVTRPIREIERELPDGTIFSAYSAFNDLFNEAPADYSEVWVYTDPDLLTEVRERFPPNNLPANLFLLKADANLLGNSMRYCKRKSIVSIPQLYVDLWNLPSWYSKEYITALEAKIMEMKDGILE